MPIEVKSEIAVNVAITPSQIVDGLISKATIQLKLQLDQAVRVTGKAKKQAESLQAEYNRVIEATNDATLAAHAAPYLAMISGFNAQLGASALKEGFLDSKLTIVSYKDSKQRRVTLAFDGKSSNLADDEANSSYCNATVADKVKRKPSAKFVGKFHFTVPFSPEQVALLEQIAAAEAEVAKGEELVKDLRTQLTTNRDQLKEFYNGQVTTALTRNLRGSEAIYRELNTAANEKIARALMPAAFDESPELLRLEAAGK
jgi:hypothetical protein